MDELMESKHVVRRGKYFWLLIVSLVVSLFVLPIVFGPLAGVFGYLHNKHEYDDGPAMYVYPVLFGLSNFFIVFILAGIRHSIL